jgi:PAS domain-containing protein
VYAADGALVRMTGTSMDITERKQAERALQACEERLRKLYKGIPVPTYSWLQTGDDFVLEDYNDAAEAVTDGRVRGWLGTRASEQYAEQPRILAELRACVAEQRTLRGEMHDADSETSPKRNLTTTFVFVPPQTVMLHTEDLSEGRDTEQRHAPGQAANGAPDRGTVAEQPVLFVLERPALDGQPLDVKTGLPEAA